MGHHHARIRKGTCSTHLKEFVCKFNPHNPPAKRCWIPLGSPATPPCSLASNSHLERLVHRQILHLYHHLGRLYLGIGSLFLKQNAVTIFGHLHLGFLGVFSGYILFHLDASHCSWKRRSNLDCSCLSIKPHRVTPQLHLSQLPWVKSPAWMTKVGTIRWNFTPNSCTATEVESYWVWSRDGVVWLLWLIHK